jgi:flavin reductase (DIM6/NTAB) family NADH-FMN oxidoreductase RutF
LPLATVKRARLSLKFLERQGDHRVLGEIGLRPTEAISLDDGQLFLFEPHHCKNYCVSRPWLWMRYLFFAYHQWQARKCSLAPELQIPAGQLHCLFVFYICPRPVVLVSVAEANLVNIVPMDLIGPVSLRCFSLALHSTSTAAPLIEGSRRIAISSVPSEQAAVAYRLGNNHKSPCADVERLPFATTRTAAFGLPVPQFALRVREMQIESVRAVGGYKFFLASTIGDRWLAEGPQFFLVHGFHQRLVTSSEISLAALGS